MKLENQCCSPKQAKRLKELGIEAQPLFWHEHLWQVSWRITQLPDGSFPIFPAFTVAELGVMLSDCGNLPDYSEHYRRWKILLDPNKGLHYFDTEAQVRAALLIYLLENNVVTAEECNKRLTE